MRARGEDERVGVLIRDLLDVSYAAASSDGYLWHEFGDVHLILP